MDSKETCKILMLPWLAHGHISPFVELAKKVTKSRKNFHAYICSTPVNLNPLKENQLDSIEFIEMHLPHTPQLPPNYHTTKNLPPNLIPLLKTAFDGAKDGFRDTIKTLKPDLVIYDFLQPWAPEVAREEGIPSVLFVASSAASFSFLTHLSMDPDSEYPLPGFQFSKPERENMLMFLYLVANGITNKDRAMQCIAKSCRFLLIKTVDEIEMKYVAHFSDMTQKEVIPVGMLTQQIEDKSSDSKIMEFLNKRDPSSVVYVSFGSEWFLPEDEIKVVAQGLELSKVNFIWVVRFHGKQQNGSTLDDMLPENFQENVAERGMVLEGWAPQAKILSHKSVGAFVSHCGWSSSLESISFGVPIIAMPMQADQPMNARLVCDVGVGIEVQRKNGKFEKEEIAKAIREVVIEEHGKEMRKNVREMSKKIREKGDQEMDNVVLKLLELVKESRLDTLRAG